MANPIERRHQSPEGEDTERGKAVGSREGEKFGDQITAQNNDRENYRGGEPLGNLCRKRPFPDEKEAENNQRNVYHHIRKQENVENAARIVAESLDEMFQGWMRFLELAQLMGLEGKERGFEPGKKRRPENQDGDGEEAKDKGRQRHFSLRRRWCNRSSSRKVKLARLPIIAGAIK